MYGAPTDTNGGIDGVECRRLVRLSMSRDSVAAVFGLAHSRIPTARYASPGLVGTGRRGS